MHYLDLLHSTPLLHSLQGSLTASASKPPLPLLCGLNLHEGKGSIFGDALIISGAYLVGE
jgi:hypothetical protein